MREKWIVNIKFIASVGVVLCHFTKAFAVSGANVPNLLNILNKYPLSCIINGEFWVCVFAILSGYLLGKKKIDSIKSLTKASVNRYLRFVIPFFFANIFVFFLSCINAFSAEECGTVIKNEWIAHQYINRFNLIDVVKNSVMLGSKLNNNFWIIKHMLIGSWLIYLFNYLSGRKNLEIVKGIIAIALLLFPYTFFISAVFIGSLLPNIIKKTKQYSDYVWIALCLLMLLLMSGIQNIISESIGVKWLHINQYWELLYAMGILVSINSAGRLFKGFNNCFLNKISKQSMSIYLLHWPLMCSFSMWCFIKLMEKCNMFNFYYWITLGLTIVVLEIVVFCYDKVFGRFSDWILKRITLK